MKKLLFILMLSAVLSGCRDDESAVNTPYIEHYLGTYMVRNTTEVILMAKIDSVEWTVTDAETYTMKFSRVNSLDDVDFCDCDGRLDKNTSTVMSFEPLVITPANCDTLRIPRGDFTPDYYYHQPDTIYFEKTIGDSLFRLVVLLQ